MQVFVNKSGDSTNERPASPAPASLAQASFNCPSPPVLCSTPKSLSHTSAEENDWQEDGDDTVLNETATETVESPEQESDQQENDMGMFFHYALYGHSAFCIVQG